MNNKKSHEQWWEELDYNVGDILVKSAGSKAIYTVTRVTRGNYEPVVPQITIHDSTDNLEKTYNIYDIGTWMFVKHYPVLKDDDQ
jgi:hypothetical protein